MSIRLEYVGPAPAEFALVPVACRHAVLEHLTRFAAAWETVARRTAPPLRLGWRTGVYCRRPDDSATLIQFSFTLSDDQTIAYIDRVLVDAVPRIPDWVRHPDEWYQEERPFPIVDVEADAA